jgi:hypothetical protein
MGCLMRVCISPFVFGLPNQLYFSRSNNPHSKQLAPYLDSFLTSQEGPVMLAGLWLSIAMLSYHENIETQELLGETSLKLLDQFAGETGLHLPSLNSMRVLARDDAFKELQI